MNSKKRRMLRQAPRDSAEMEPAVKEGFVLQHLASMVVMRAYMQ